MIILVIIFARKPDEFNASDAGLVIKSLELYFANYMPGLTIIMLVLTLNPLV